MNLSVHLARLTGGRRKVVSISEVTGMEGDVILLQDVFKYRQTGVGPDGHAEGYMEVCGVRPQLLNRLEAEGVRLPESFFSVRVLTPVKSEGKQRHVR